MTKHYSEADLLETYYTQPGDSMPVMMHVAECSECAARYQRLDRKLREAAVCNTERPETFWSRQRIAIMRKIERHAAAARGAVRTGRVAAAALLAFLLGGAVVYKSVEPALTTPPVVITQAHQTEAPATDDDELQVPRDPWQSDELQDFHGVVQWESWVAQTKAVNEESSL